MSASDLLAFSRWLDEQVLAGNLKVPQAITTAASPGVILAIAEQQGFVLTAEELREASRQLSASYWPWAGKGHGWRRAFFNG